MTERFSVHHSFIVDIDTLRSSPFPPPLLLIMRFLDGFANKARSSVTYIYGWSGAWFLARQITYCFAFSTLAMFWHT